ncbi:hypothetical protein AHIS1636_38480 [Arthrobacter mangrovi]|uniref:Uncharacterized protein n=1 Tax=Arthrobacter mangrovi TaxID=2966350 RepID=A0ABQ5MZN1_9MICC|nr:hypothetical protein AHIS1636_38480 [Arthrobacter mangrovi]
MKRAAKGSEYLPMKELYASAATSNITSCLLSPGSHPRRSDGSEAPGVVIPRSLRAVYAAPPSGSPRFPT